MDASEEYRELLSLYKRAEDLLHSLGVDTSIDTSAINELRYAGRHALNAFVAGANGDAEEEGKQLSRAEAHCERAMYDAYDGAIFFHLQAFQVFIDDYRLIVIPDVLPDYVETTQRMEGAKRFLEEARRQEDDRAAYYDQAGEHYRQIANAMSGLQAARVELNKKVADYNAQIERTVADEERTAAAMAASDQARGEAARGRKQTLWIAGVTTAINIAFWLVRLFFEP